MDCIKYWINSLFPYTELSIAFHALHFGYNCVIFQLQENLNISESGFNNMKILHNRLYSLNR